MVSHSLSIFSDGSIVSHSIYEIIPLFPSNDGIPGDWTVAVQPLYDIPKGGTKDGTTLTTRWQNHVQSLNSEDAFRVLQIQGGFWVNFPNLWARIQNIGICGQYVSGEVVKAGTKLPEYGANFKVTEDWLKTETYKILDTPYYDASKIHEVYMINEQNELRPIRSFPVRIILISATGFLWLQMSRLRKIN